mgnify:CR=1 FL=1
MGAAWPPPAHCTPNTTGGGTVYVAWRHFFGPDTVLLHKSEHRVEHKNRYDRDDINGMLPRRICSFQKAQRKRKAKSTEKRSMRAASRPGIVKPS